VEYHWSCSFVRLWYLSLPLTSFAPLPAASSQLVACSTMTVLVTELLWNIQWNSLFVHLQQPHKSLKTRMIITFLHLRVNIYFPSATKQALLSQLIIFSSIRQAIFC